MTQVNAGIEPWELSDRLLCYEMADLQQIPQKVTAMEANRNRRTIGNASRVNILEGVPAVFCAAPEPGHVRFFYPRIEYLHKRYQRLRKESQNRGIKLPNCDAVFRVPAWYYGDWIETDQARRLAVERIESTGGRLRIRRKKPIKI